MRLDLQNYSCGWHGVPLITDVNLTAASGKILCILGPNGIGKSTLFKTLLGLLPPLSGSASIDGRDLASLSPGERARLLSYVPQSEDTPFAYTAEQLVVMGCAPRLGAMAAPTAADYRDAEAVMERLSIAHLKDRAFHTLSGGEKQLVLIARALNQRAAFLLLDEPAASLDLKNQAEVIEVLKQTAKTSTGVILTTHQPDHVFQMGGSVCLLGRDGMITGPVQETLTEETLSRTFGIPVVITSAEKNGRTVHACVPFSEEQTQNSAFL